MNYGPYLIVPDAFSMSVFARAHLDSSLLQYYRTFHLSKPNITRLLSSIVRCAFVCFNTIWNRFASP